MKPLPFLLKIACAGLPLVLACSVSVAGDISKGRQLFGTHCKMCHGPTGRSVMPGAPNFDRGEALMRPDSALLATIKAGKNACPSFFGVMPDRDILDVISFLRTLH